MQNIKEQLKTKKGKIILGVITTLVVVLCIGGGYVYSENQKEQKAMNAMQITFKEDVKLEEIEYGSTVEVKDLVNEVAGGEVKNYPTVDTTTVGEKTLKFVVTKGKYSKEIEQKIKVVDTKAPEIALEADTKKLIVGDEYDIHSNITSVKDPIDGDIAISEDAKNINEKATKEYNEIEKKDEITAETKIGDKLLTDFVIVGEEETKTLFLKNCYYVDGSVDTATVGDYKISVIATDKNGIQKTSEFTVTVKEKPVEKSKPVSGNSTNGGDYSTSYPNGNGNSGGGSSSGSGNAAVAPKGKDWMLNYAFSKVGVVYPTCQAFVDDVLRASGYLSPSQPNFAYGGYTIKWQDLGPGDVLMTTSPDGVKHVRMITSYPTIDEYGNYTWEVLEASINAAARARSLQYHPSMGSSLDYILRY